MSVPTPAINAETAQHLVQRTANLAAALTAQSLAPAAAEGYVLAVDVLDPQTQVVLALAGTRVDAALVQTLEIAGIAAVTVRGWWPNLAQPDAGLALIDLFSRMASQAVERINQAADKNFLAYLALIGTEQAPPRPARAPLSFYLVKNSPVDAWVAQGAQASARSAAGEVVFETTAELVVTRAQLQAVLVKNPASDQYSNNTALAAASGTEAFAAFVGNTLIEHSLYLAAATLFGYAGDTLALTLNAASTNDAKLMANLARWEYWNGQAWQTLTVTSTTPTTSKWQVSAVLPTLSTTSVNAQSAQWLRARLTSAIPATVPTLTTLSAQVTRAVTAVSPDKGYTNTSALDFTKDFYPFGTRPAFNDTFYISSKDVLSQAGGNVTVLVTLSPSQMVKTDGGATLTWEVYNGQAWQTLTVTSKIQSGSNWVNPTSSTQDPKNFTNSGQVIFTLPSSLGQGTVNSQKGYWLRVRLTAGNYGTTAQYKNTGTADNPQYVLSQLENYQPPSVQSLTLSASSTVTGKFTAVLTYNDFVFADVTTTANTTTGTVSFRPYTPTTETNPALYLGFDRAFANAPTTLYVQAIAPDPSEVSATVFAGTNPQDNPPQVVWEYSTASGWRTLNVEDGTQTLAESGLLQFVGPADFGAGVAFGQTGYWLRARWASGTFVFPPQVGHVLTNTTWALQSQTYTNETLGSSNGNPSQTFKTAQAPVLRGQVVQVEEKALPDEIELAALGGPSALSVTYNTAGQITAVWVQWIPVPNFYRSGPRDRHYVFDPLTGTVQFGDGVQGMAPPAGSNNIRVARYQVGGGAQGNVAASTITQLKSSWPYVDRISNVEAAASGADTESLAEVKDRGPRFLRHRGRAVAAVDFEDLALAASLAVARAQAIVPPDLASSDYFFEPSKTNPNTPPADAAQRILNAVGVAGQVAYGQVQPGQVGLVLVANSPAALPAPSPILLQEVRSYVLARSSPTLDLWVTGPDWVKVIVTATLVPTSLDVADTLAQTVSAILEKFLHPLTGGLNSDGWPFGQLPHLSTLTTLLENIAGVDYVYGLQATYTADSDVYQVRNAVTDSARLTSVQLIYSGTHVITLKA